MASDTASGVKRRKSLEIGTNSAESPDIEFG
jgi:hypothetical protein